jgi:hypothetical protein
MALIFSPLSEDILSGAFIPFPKSAFLMMQDNEGTPPLDSEMERIARTEFHDLGLDLRKASEEAGTKDFLEKILALIRGSGFGVAIFSEFTDPRSLANIFFEIGICNMLGKPVILLKSKDARVPSDFTRTEWISYNHDADELGNHIRRHVDKLERSAGYYQELGDIAAEARSPDWDLAFERYKQSFLILGSDETRSKMIQLQQGLKTHLDHFDRIDPMYIRLHQSMTEFTRLSR